MLNIEEEFKLFEKYNCWDQVYEKIVVESEARYEFSSSDARKSNFRDRNRYRDVIPYNHSRIKLPIVDYINASHVLVPENNEKYILTQAPMANTISHFWLMVWTEDCGIIIMLSKNIENKMIKGDPYHPGDTDMPFLDSNGVLNLEDVSLKISLTSTFHRPYFKFHTFLITNTSTNESRTVNHLQYTEWPDAGVPEEPANFLSFMEVAAAERTVGKPPLIHCSAGVGRSGSYVLIETCIAIGKKNIGSLKVMETLISLRRYRSQLVQTKEQLRFSYWCVLAKLKEKKLLPLPRKLTHAEEMKCFKELQIDEDPSSSASYFYKPNESRNNNEDWTSDSSVKNRTTRHSLSRVVPHQASLDDPGLVWASNQLICGEPVITPGEVTTPGARCSSSGLKSELIVDEEEENNFADDEVDEWYEEDEEDDDVVFKFQHLQVRRRPIEERQKQTWRDLYTMKNSQSLYGVTQSRIKQPINIVLIVFVISITIYFFFFRSSI